MPWPSLEGLEEDLIEMVSKHRAWLTNLPKLLPTNTQYPTGEPFFLDVICRTLIANVTHMGTLAPESCLAHSRSYLTFTLQDPHGVSLFALVVRSIYEPHVAKAIPENIQLSSWTSA